MHGQLNVMSRCSVKLSTAWLGWAYSVGLGSSVLVFTSGSTLKLSRMIVNGRDSC